VQPTPDIPQSISRRHFAAATLALAASPALVRAQGFPDKPMRILVGFSAGSPSDVLARAMGEKMSKLLGQPIIIENKPGAGGVLAIKTLLQAPADGHTLLVVSAAHAAKPAITRNLGFDPVKDLAGITRIASVPSILIVNPKLGIGNVRELLAKLKQTGGSMPYSTPGRGSANHFAVEQFLAEAGVKATDVPYKGVPEAVSAVVSGECHFSFIPVPNVLQLVQSERITAIATSTGNRTKVLPNVPTVAEGGVPGYVFDPWFGLLTQSAVPPATLAKLVATSQTALADPEMRTRFDPIGADVNPLAGAQFDKYIREELSKFKRIAVAAKIEST
jgi:tripartite-type tricarboxylate transporter receptor subunit TctC